jgi:tRNA1(Val) A37 N6-methylase TrmN6
LSYEDLVETAVKHLKDNGILALVLPFEVLDKIVAIAAKNKLYIHRQLTLYSRPHKRPLRILIEFANKDIVQPESNSLCIKDSKNEYTESYKGYLNQYYTIF